MSWIKRNLSLVISGVIALGLLGFGGWYLWSAMKKNAEIDNQINQAKADINALLEKDPTPTTSNLNYAKRELERLNVFVAHARQQFPPTPPPAVPLNNESFKNLLEKTIDDLHKEAGAATVKVDSNYYFSFNAQRESVMFAPESMRPLYERLHEVQALSEILFNARIAQLISIQRALVPGEKPGSGTGDYLNRGARTNAETGMVLWPYEVTFYCFTPELAAVIDGLQHAPEGFVLRVPLVEALEEKTSTTAPARPPPNIPPGPRAAPNAPVAAPQPLVTIVDEKKLRVVLRIEVIKPEPFGPNGPGNFGPRRGPGGGPPP